MKKRLLLFALLLSSACMPMLAQGDLPQRMHRHCGTSMILEREAKNGDTRAISQAENYVPHTDSVTIPVILVNFKDVQFSVNNPHEAFNQFFNATDKLDSLGNGNQYNYGSVAKYFNDMSRGAFNLSFKVYGPVTLDNNETYYGGSNENDNNDEEPRQLVVDAIAKLQASPDSITDASAFSTDGSTIDCVYIVYAGMGQNDGGSGTTVWANTGNLNNASIAGKRVRWYSMAGELAPAKLNINGRPTTDSTGVIPMITGIGVTCHEFSHALGLPDIYPTSNNAQKANNQNMEYWDLMDGGEYTENGYRPTAYTAFEKNEMGWQVDIRELTESQTVNMTTSTEQGGTAYKITNPNNSNEYFMLECIQRRGWNRYLYGNGLLVYHVNRPQGDISISTTFNNSANYPGMAVVPADGACLSSYIDDNRNTSVSYTVGGNKYTENLYTYSLRGDLFPGSDNLPVDTLNVSELSDAKPQPNFCWYNSSMTQKLATNKALQNIRYNPDGSVSFNYIHDVAATGIKKINVNDKDKDSNIYSIDGRYVGKDPTILRKGIYIIGGKKIMK